MMRMMSAVEERGGVVVVDGDRGALSRSSKRERKPGRIVSAMVGSAADWTTIALVDDLATSRSIISIIRRQHHLHHLHQSSNISISINHHHHH
jgi:hypothetical protein